MFGELTDVYIPKPFRGFGFVTFLSSESVRRVMGSNHVINSAHLNMTFAEPKSNREDDGGFHGMNQFGPNSTGGNAPFPFMNPRSGGGKYGNGSRSGSAYNWNSRHSESTSRR